MGRLVVDKSDKWRSQRDNKLYPLGACNTTSMVMALEQAAYSVGKGKGMPEDRLMAMLRTDEAYAEMERDFSWAKDTYPPNQVHGMLERYANRFVREHNPDVGDADVVEFRTDWHIEDLLLNVFRGGGVVVSGVFEYRDKVLNHIVSIGGFACTQDIPDARSVVEDHGDRIPHAYVETIIIDDPFGDYKTQYAEHHGSGIPMPREDFLEIMRPSKAFQKWAHFVKPRTQVVRGR